ncbi:hypothetical protein DCC62_32820 [candidate division KSB1 bacterium]|nr:hypothetical protein [candidate division KSB1 bacterium]RIK52582.1 MAG: hypothetical protein DCC62_32820 [candidate division KSB1 bacterium]
MNINEYIAELETRIQSAAIVASYIFNVDRKTEDLVFISGRIDFRDGSILDFKEFIMATDHGITKLKYGYNYRIDSEPLFRYDNALDPRAKALPSYPHHKHESDGKISVSNEIGLPEVLEEVESAIIRRRWQF